MKKANMETAKSDELLSKIYKEVKKIPIKDECYENTHLSVSSILQELFLEELKLHNFKFILPTAEELEKNEIYGYVLVKPEYEKAALAIIDSSEFFNSDGIHIRQPENMNKLKDAGVLDLWFKPVYESNFLKIM